MTCLQVAWLAKLSLSRVPVILLQTAYAYCNGSIFIFVGRQVLEKEEKAKHSHSSASSVSQSVHVSDSCRWKQANLPWDSFDPAISVYIIRPGYYTPTNGERD